MIRLRMLQTLLLVPALLGAQNAPQKTAEDYSKLPDWAAASAVAAAAESAPADADAWVLLDRTEFAYRGDGEIRKRSYRLVRVLTERGLEQATFYINGLGGRASKVKKLKGWNLRPDSTVMRLDDDEVVTVGQATASNLSSAVATLATLPGVVKGSLVAFESQELIKPPTGPSATTRVLQAYPIRRWELDLVSAVGWFSTGSDASVGMKMRTAHFQPLLPAPPQGTSLHLENLPPLPKHESGAPSGHNFLPQVSIDFTDPALKGVAPLTSWDALASWYEAQVAPLSAPLALPLAKPAAGAAALAPIHRWMQRELAYRQVYLTPERSYIPENAPEVLRKRFGDCKDLTALYLAAARSAGLEAHPALARIADGSVSPGDPVAPSAFNHVIAAIRLEHSLGLPAERETPQGRFLLVDPTDRFTPLGRLHASHRTRHLLICLPKGGQWVEIPAAATVRPRTRVVLEAAPTPTGSLKGTLTFREEGGALDLREAALTGGPKAVKDRVGSLLGLSPGSSFTLEPLDDPLDGSEAFEVRLAFEEARGLQPFGREWLLPAFGLPMFPAAIQKRGRPRVQPVHAGALADWDYEATVQLPPGKRPALPKAALETPWRTVTWSAEPQEDRWHVILHQTQRPVAYEYERREAGVEAHRLDRNQLQVFLVDVRSVVKSD